MPQKAQGRRKTTRRRPAARKATGGPEATPRALRLAKAAWLAGFGFSDGRGGGRSIDNPPELVLAVAIGLAESGDDPHQVNRNNSNGTYDYGGWMVNSVHTRDGRAAKQSGRFDHRRLTRDLNYNARAAKAIYDDKGNWTPWSSYNSGAHNAHRLEAATAAKQLKLLGPNPAGAGGNWATALDERIDDVTSNPLSIFEGWADDAIKILLTGALAATGLALFGYGLVKASGAGKVADAAKTAAGAGVPAAVARARGVA